MQNPTANSVMTAVRHLRRPLAIADDNIVSSERLVKDGVIDASWGLRPSMVCCMFWIFFMENSLAYSRPCRGDIV